MTQLVDGLFGQERRCEPGGTDYPADCERHEDHYWCTTCVGYYGVSHNRLHTRGHVDRNFRDCACRPCGNRRDEIAARMGRR